VVTRLTRIASPLNLDRNLHVISRGERRVLLGVFERCRGVGEPGFGLAQFFPGFVIIDFGLCFFLDIQHFGQVGKHR